MIQLTHSQHLALAIDRNILIEAGAGSGKTTIIIERFLDNDAKDESHSAASACWAC